MGVDKIRDIGTSSGKRETQVIPKITENKFNKLNAAKQGQYGNTYKQEDGTTSIFEEYAIDFSYNDFLTFSLKKQFIF
jgi:hypothetical protein